MKKFAILALAAVMVIALTVPAAALENEFGGYWRTRMINQGHFNGEDNDDTNQRRVDTRTRLYYTAKINDNLKLVNQFEMNAVWGEPVGYGAVGADGLNVLVRHSYADFNLGPVNITMGAQPYALFRSFHIDADASGIIARWKVLDNFVLAGSWLKAWEGGNLGTGNNNDVDAYTLSGALWFSENMSIRPSISYARSSEAANYIGAVGLVGVAGPLGTAPVNAALVGVPGELELWTYGFDFDASWDNFGVFATLYGQSGELETSINDIDFAGWLLNVGGNVVLGPVDLHAEFIYTPGDDDSDDELEQIYSPLGSHYWAEIMGLGIFDQQASAGSPADQLQNIMAVNIGFDMKPMDKLKLAVDLWYAELVEDRFGPGSTATASGEDELGVELDVVVTYQLIEGLNLDLVGAYLWAGDATSLDGSNNEDPYEFGARLSLSF
jgi:hypothetical protein